MAAGFGRQTLIFACVFVVRLLSEHDVLSAKKWKRTDGGGCASVSFVRNVFHFLTATNVGSHLVQKVGICAHMCVDNLLCFSYNIAAQPDINGRHFLCELLASDMYNSSDQLLPHPDSITTASRWVISSTRHITIFRNPLNNFGKLVRIYFLAQCHSYVRYTESLPVQKTDLFF